MPQVHRRNYNNHQAHASQEKIPVKRDVTNVVTPHMWRDLDVQPVDINARIATSLVISVACATRKKSLNTRESQEDPEHIN